MKKLFGIAVLCGFVSIQATAEAKSIDFCQIRVPQNMKARSFLGNNRIFAFLRDEKDILSGTCIGTSTIGRKFNKNTNGKNFLKYLLSISSEDSLTESQVQSIVESYTTKLAKSLVAQKGDTGAEGAKGETGARGEQGLQGEAGSKGDKGDTGATGIQGLKGDKGDRGDQGLSGLSGVNGKDGAQGPMGPKGDIGPKGDKGDTGTTGIQGLKGDKGERGERGQQGEVGAKGEKGDSGVVGSQGIQGIKGDKGDTGPTGLPGLNGKDGAAGAVGPKGEVGSKGDKGEAGATGIQGPKGDKGDRGERGLQGEVGPKGEMGMTGPVGPRGETGSAGSNGQSALSNKCQTVWYDFNSLKDESVRDEENESKKHARRGSNHSIDFTAACPNPESQGIINYYHQAFAISLNTEDNAEAIAAGKYKEVDATMTKVQPIMNWDKVENNVSSGVPQAIVGRVKYYESICKNTYTVVRISLVCCPIER